MAGDELCSNSADCGQDTTPGQFDDLAERTARLIFNRVINHECVETCQVKLAIAEIGLAIGILEYFASTDNRAG